MSITVLLAPLDSNAIYTSDKGVARGGARGARAPPNLADQLTLFKPWGADYVHHNTASPPRFKMLYTPLILNSILCSLAMKISVFIIKIS